MRLAALPKVLTAGGPPKRTACAPSSVTTAAGYGALLSASTATWEIQKHAQIPSSRHSSTVGSGAYCAVSALLTGVTTDTTSQLNHVEMV